MAKPRNGSSRVSNSSDMADRLHTRRSRRQLRTSAAADALPSSRSGRRQRLRGQHPGVPDEGDGGDDEGGPPRPSHGGGTGQEHWAGQVTDAGRDRAGGQRADQVVAGQVDQGHLARGDHRVGGEPEQERAGAEHPGALAPGPAGHGHRAAEGSQRGLEPPADPVGGDAEEPTHEPAGMDQHEEERDLPEGQVEVRSDGLDRARGQEREPLVQQPDDEQRSHEPGRCSSQDGQQAPGVARRRRSVVGEAGHRCSVGPGAKDGGHGFGLPLRAMGG